MRLKKLLISAGLFLVLAVPSIALAQGAAPLVNDMTRAEQYTQETAFGNASGINMDASVGSIVANVIKAVLGLLAIIFVILMLYAGYLWMTAQGNEDQVGKAKGIITTAIIGLIIIVAAYSITSFVFKSLSGASSSGGMIQ